MNISYSVVAVFSNLVCRHALALLVMVFGRSQAFLLVVRSYGSLLELM